MKKKNPTLEQQVKKYKKRFYLILSILIIFISLTGVYIYLNYDYLAFKHFITGHYIYTETLDQLFQNELKRDIDKKYFEYFDDLVISTVTKRIREINNDKYTYLYLPEAYEKSKREEKDDAEKSSIKPLNENTVYLHLSNFSKYTQDFIYDNINNLSKYSYLILDLRNNYGGDIFVMNNISDLFLPKGNIITIDKMRIFDRTYKAKKPTVLNFNKIIILQNQNTASSSENMISALRYNLDNVILVGETTFGKGIGQFTLPLKNGFAVKATTLLWYTPDGMNIHKKGIPPDINYLDEDILEFSLDIFAQ